MTSQGEPADLLPFTPNDHDVRIVRDRWVYYVRGVKKSQPLRHDGFFFDAAGVVEAVLSVLVIGATTIWWDRQTTWKVGVLRYPRTTTWRRIRILHKELLPDGQPPTTRIAELVDDINHGRFDVP